MTAPLASGLNARLSLMMFLQYAIWGAWLPLFYPFLTEHRGFTPGEFGELFAIGATGALLAPFIAGQIADRWFNTERFLALSHFVGAALAWRLADVDRYDSLLGYTFLYSLVYSPTIPLTNSLALHHLPDRDRDFGRVRLWGTIGWIAVGIGIGQWLLRAHTPGLPDATAVRAAQVAGMADAFRLAAGLGAVLGLYSLFLPRTPPQPGRERFAPKEALGEIKRMPLLALFLIAFPVSCIHQFYFFHTAGFLGHLEAGSETIDAIFGVGGGGLMTIGQMAEILVLAAMPFLAKRLRRKTLLAVGLVAYALRFAVFAYLPELPFVLPALALHGLCFGCFIFVAFLIVDEETTPDVRASAQSLFNLVVIGIGIIAGNYVAGRIGDYATADKTTDYTTLFSVPMWAALASLLTLLVWYPKGSRGK